MQLDKYDLQLMNLQFRVLSCILDDDCELYLSDISGRLSFKRKVSY